MKKLTSKVVAIAALSILGTQALASSTETLPEERRGAVIGGIIGASVGGPIGAGAGAMLGGGVIGKAVGISRQNRELTAEMTRAKQDKKRRESELKAEIAQLNRALSKAKSAQAVAQAPEVPIQFRTASSSIESHYEGQLAEIAAAVAKRPDAKVTLSGFADRRGDVDYNQKLSETRVDEVKRFLVNHGVRASQIETQAFGESLPVAKEQNAENDFFDRRVVMQFSIGSDATPLAAR